MESLMKVGYIVEGFNDEQKLKNICPEIRCAVTQGNILNMKGKIKKDNVENASELN
jgi:hypothetical protein